MTGTSQQRLHEIVERFFGIAEDDATELIEELDTVNVAGGQWLMRQGDVADSLYFLIRGRMQVWIEPELNDGVNQPRLVGEVAPGDSVGEIGLLTGGHRTAGIKAIRDSQLLKLDRAAFEHFAETHPGLVMQLAGSIARRLTERTKHAPSASRNLSTVAIVPLDDAPWVDDFCNELSSALDRRGKTLCLTSRNLGQMGAPVASIDNDERIPEALKHWLDVQENDHRLMLYVADAADARWSRLCVRQADIVLLLADAESDPQPRRWEQPLLDLGGADAARRALLLRHQKADTTIAGTDRWLEPRDVDFHLHLQGAGDELTGRIARMLTGEAVGLVLGGGAARGFAEIGVYRALHEAGVPIDWVGGTSIGGIIGAAIAQDQGPDAVLETAREAFVKGKPFGDYTLPLMSLLRGKRMERLTQQHLPGNIEDLAIPFFCVSARLDVGETCVHQSGPIWRALRATAALPGMLPPAVIEGRLLVDGAVVNNLPVDIMREKLIGHVIAVDLASRRVHNVTYTEIPSPWALLRSRVLPGGTRYHVPGVVSVLLKSAEIGTAAKMRELAGQADLLLQPPVTRFGLTDVRSFDKIVQAGYDDARERIAGWLDNNADVTS
jgi:predicted acylesterase/phospholipase RssA/CRP-like cAMP-binding protein